MIMYLNAATCRVKRPWMSCRKWSLTGLHYAAIYESDPSHLSRNLFTRQPRSMATTGTGSRAFSPPIIVANSFILAAHTCFDHPSGTGSPCTNLTFLPSFSNALRLCSSLNLLLSSSATSTKSYFITFAPSRTPYRSLKLLSAS